MQSLRYGINLRAYAIYSEVAGNAQRSLMAKQLKHMTSEADARTILIKAPLTLRPTPTTPFPR